MSNRSANGYIGYILKLRDSVAQAVSSVDSCRPFYSWMLHEAYELLHAARPTLCGLDYWKPIKEATCSKGCVAVRRL